MSENLVRRQPLMAIGVGYPIYYPREQPLNVQVVELRGCETCNNTCFVVGGLDDCGGEAHALCPGPGHTADKVLALTPLNEGVYAQEAARFRAEAERIISRDRDTEADDGTTRPGSAE